MIQRWHIAVLLVPLLFAPGALALAQPAPPPAASDAAASATPAQLPVSPGTPAVPEPVQAAAPVAVPATAASPASLHHDLSPWSMFLNADIVVKAVMVGLLAASVATWTIWLGKTLQLATARHRAIRGLKALTEADGLAALAKSDAFGTGPVGTLVRAAAAEVKRSAALPAEGIKERAALSLGRIEARASRGIMRGTGLLATVGSTAPFVGLFGTVWGIMNSFVGISQAHTSNLAVVAPGIAEALLATAVGLVAAIPAVVIFNGFARSTAGYKALLGDASAEVLRHLSRDLDRRPMLRRQAAE